MATYYRWRRRAVTYSENKTRVDNDLMDTHGPMEYGNWPYSYSNSIRVDSRGIHLISPTSGTIAFDENENYYGYYLNFIGVVWYSSSGSFNVSRTSGTQRVYISSRGGQLYTVTAQQNVATSGDYVYSTSSTAYPNGGASGSYYYDQRTELGNLVLSIPEMFMHGQQATIIWTAITGADSYTLQRKANTDTDWVQVYSGANTSFSETAGTWTTVQYRVQAVFDGTPGGWVTSESVPAVSPNALVISGSDGDLGTVVNDIPYTISTDTGNQITATITVNSAVIFSGNVGTGTADSIPVLDLVNGEGTIVIEASVQATGGPVSAVRTWTYTKSPITFPNAGSVAQLTQQEANIWPKTLAECVRLPGGKTLDEVTGFPCQVYSGSYVGTGTYGASNPNTLTAPFKPKAVFVAGSGAPAGQSLTMINPNAFAYGTINATASALTLSWDENSVSYYNASNANQQFNANGSTYYYALFG